jgi:hypothetical protein
MRGKLHVLGLLVIIVAFFVACGGDDAADAPDSPPTTDPADDVETSDGVDELVRLNQLQAIGSHNSYKLRPAPDVLEAIALFSPQLAEEIDYEHRTLTEQLEEFGLLQIELDVYADPEGGRFADRPALEILGRDTASGAPELDEPGFKALHQVDIDFEAHCLTLIICLEEVEQWSSAQPDHLPLMIMVEAKQVPLEVAAASMGIDLSDLPVTFTDVLAFDRELFDDLEAEILSVFDPDRIITPDDVRGDHDTLEAAVLTGEAWPTLAESRGKVLFSLIDTGETRETYIGEATSLEGRLLFTSSEEGRPDAAFIRADDPVANAERIPQLVDAGYLIRTRSDVPAVHAAEDDTTWREAALNSGAHYISTDYYTEDPDLGTGFVVRLPDWAQGQPAARCNPVNAPEECDAAALGLAGG